MKKSIALMSLWAVSMLMIDVVHAAECKCSAAEAKEEVKEAETKPKCPVDAKDGCDGGYCGKEAKEDHSVDYQGRKVLFCCEGCIEEFNKSPDAYAEQVKAQWALLDSKKEEKK